MKMDSAGIIANLTWEGIDPVVYGTPIFQNNTKTEAFGLAYGRSGELESPLDINRYVCFINKIDEDEREVTVQCFRCPDGWYKDRYWV